MIDTTYKGYIECSLSDSQLADYYISQCGCLMNAIDTSKLTNNTYVIVEDKTGYPLEYLKYQDGVFRTCKYPVIGGGFTEQIKPRNKAQYCAMDLLLDQSVAIKMLTGCFGSGKSLISIASALQQVELGKFDKLIYIRNNIQVRDTDQIGALPGLK